MVNFFNALILACTATTALAAQARCGSDTIDTDLADCYPSNDASGTDFACGKVNGVSTLACGKPVCYLPSMYTCYPGNQLCPVVKRSIHGTVTDLRTKACGKACYLDIEYPCINGTLGPHKPLLGNHSLMP